MMAAIAWPDGKLAYAVLDDAVAGGGDCPDHSAVRHALFRLRGIMEAMMVGRREVDRVGVGPPAVLTLGEACDAILQHENPRVQAAVGYWLETVVGKLMDYKPLPEPDVYYRNVEWAIYERHLACQQWGLHVSERVPPMGWPKPE